jgi:hypothetical protein
MMATTSDEAPVYLWDVYAPAGPDTDWSDKKIWGMLQDSSSHFAAMTRMIANPERAVAMCRDRIKPLPKPNETTVRRLLSDLDNSDHAIRDRAEMHLTAFGDSIESIVRRELQATNSAEKTSRLKRLLLNMAKLPAEGMRDLRSLEVLEQIGTAEARKLMAEWADGDMDNSFTREAKKSLERMKAR